MPVLATTIEYVRVSPGSTVPESLASSLAAIALVTVICGSAAVIGTVTVSLPCTLPPPGAVPEAVAVLVRLPVDASAGVTR